ncbi:MAG: hemolysin family protein [Sphaerochaetaceae bacterium]|nr:hemolysin family protein [Sphaerochaetaceae bacterium]MDD2405643.1 hemolysin family protein [Sphaerochaetaceae bacterium]MDD3670424.1 hemolysin family protein [Sphaerochaetaceae bacterium]MDD4260428.1 hemolysin family protein [Sphaerochaetaceae bacterium]MDD4842201.1 hemolysin family protein [Sphaerochaetaceae bacterium]
MKFSERLRLLVGRPVDPVKNEDAEVVEERKNMIEGIGELAETTVREVMVPRIDVQFVSDTTSLDELYKIIAEQGYSRYPVFTDTIDNVVGVLYVKDILKRGPDKPFELRSVMRKPYFVPDTKRLDDLLREFKKRKVHIAVAIDEYGGVSGIVSMEDILEVIVGEIQDEFDDDEEEGIVTVSEGIFICDARVSIDELNERLNLVLPEDDFETLGGFVFELFGRIPSGQEKITYNDMDFIVQEIEGHKINRVKIVMKRP